MKTTTTPYVYWALSHFKWQYLYRVLLQWANGFHRANNAMKGTAWIGLECVIENEHIWEYTKPAFFFISSLLCIFAYTFSNGYRNSQFIRMDSNSKTHTHIYIQTQKRFRVTMKLYEIVLLGNSFWWKGNRENILIIKDINTYSYIVYI